MRSTHRIQKLLGAEIPLIQAPMAGAVSVDMVVAVSQAGGLGSLPCALLSAEQIRGQVNAIRSKTTRPFSLNFFCHATPRSDRARETRWEKRLEFYYAELGIKQPHHSPNLIPAPFDGVMCDVVMELQPEVVSFHFGLPDSSLLQRVKDTGSTILSSATTVEEARWLEASGCDAIIAQGYEAGGHRGTFLSHPASAQVGLMSLLPQVVNVVKVPVIAAGGIADARGIAAAFLLGASAAQMGTAYLSCPEATISNSYRMALKRARDSDTVITNIFTGRPARAVATRIIRELGPIAEEMPDFPRAAGALVPLRLATELNGVTDFTPFWLGQSASMNRELSAGTLTRRLADEALALLSTAGANNTGI